MKFLIQFTISIFLLLGLTNCSRLKELDFIPLEAKFKVPQPVVRVGASIEFNQQSPSEVIKEYAWDFGDNNNSVERTPQHTYREMGVYTVKLKVTKANNTTQEASDRIVVIPNTTPATGVNTTVFSEKLPTNLPAPVDEAGIRTIFVKAGIFERYYMLGRKNANGLYVIQTDKNRNEIWSKNITTISNAKINPTDILYDSVPNGRKALIIVGYTGYNENDKDSFIISLDTQTGAENWKYTNQSTNADVYNSVDIIDSYYVVSGNSTTRTQSGTDTKIKIDEFDTDGILKYSTVLNAPNSEVNDAKYVRLDNEGILACTETGIERPMLLRYTATQKNPVKSYAGNATINGKGLGLTKLTNGQYVLVGEIYYNNKKDSTNAFIALFDKDRAYLGMDVLSIYKESFFDVVQVGDAVVVVGTHYNPLSQKDILVASYTIENNKPKRQILRLIGENANEEATRLISDETGTISILGTSQSSSGGFLDMLFMKLNANTLQ